MRRFVAAGLTLVAALAITAAPAQAQFFVGAGLTAPSGDFGDFFKSGLAVNAGVAVLKSADERLKLWAEGFYGTNTAKDTDLSATMLGAFGSITYEITAAASAIPYVTAGLGYLSFKGEGESEREGGLGGLAGAGVSFGKFWLEGRYVTASICDEDEGCNLSFMGLMVGYSF